MRWMRLAAVPAVIVAAVACPPRSWGQTRPVDALAGHLAALKDVKSLTATFVCEKALAALDTPLVSSGRVWIEKPGSVRFSTQRPYSSEIILHDGKIHARSQHEKAWVTSDQKARPGLPAVMNQLAAWATGGGEEARRLAGMYDVAAADAAKLPARPGAGEREAAKVDAFALTPRDKDLAKAVRQIRLAVDAETHLLRYVEITTMQDDVTRYWFIGVKLNAEMAAGTFEAK